MAKNYTFSEVVEIVTANKDMEAIQDIGRRYPILLAKVSTVVALAGKSFADLASYFPEHLSANKVNTGIKAVVFGGETEEVDDTDADETEVELPINKPGKASPAKTAPATEEKGYAQQTGDALIAICKERKLAWKGLKKLQLIEVLETADKAEVKPAKAAGKAKAAPVVEEEDETDDAGYADKTAMELFKEAKARGLKVEAKKPAAFYIKLLEKDDASKEEVTEDGEEDWEEEEVVETPKAKAKATTAKPAAKPAAKKAVEEEEWDL